MAEGPRLADDLPRRRVPFYLQIRSRQPYPARHESSSSAATPPSLLHWITDVRLGGPLSLCSSRRRWCRRPRGLSPIRRLRVTGASAPRQYFDNLLLRIDVARSPAQVLSLFRFSPCLLIIGSPFPSRSS